MNVTPLFDKLCRKEFLWQAWKHVQKNKTAGGIDDVSIGLFTPVAGEEIARLTAEVNNNSYIPLPYKSVAIPKGQNKQRILGLLTVRDKIVQQAIYNLIQPFIDRKMLPCVYAYRQGKGAVKAIRRVQHAIVSEKFVYMVSCDLKGYFDNINHQLLFAALRSEIRDAKLINYIELCMKMGKVQRGNRWIDAEKGIPQGGVISPLLSNYYLLPLDEAMQKLNICYVRYADDFVILAKSVDEGQKAIKAINDVVLNLKLELKANASVKSLEEGFNFLGIYFSNGALALSDEKKQSMQEKLSKIFYNEEKNLIKLLKKSMDGFRAFYGSLLSENELLFLDAHLLLLIKQKAAEEKVPTIKELERRWAAFTFLTPCFENERLKHFKEIINASKQKKEPVIRDNKKLIAKRKKAYQKLESQGKDLIINSIGAYVGISEGKVNIRLKEDKAQKISFINLTHISIIGKAISMSSDFVYECTRNNVPVSFFSHTGTHYATLYNPQGTDHTLWIKQSESAQNAKACFIAALIIDAKIRNQANLLKYFHKYHKRADAGFSALFKDKISRMGVLSKKCRVLSKTYTETYKQDVMALEAEAAAIYWHLVEELINDDSTFAGRQRKGATDLVNCLFNYGYAILYARIWEAVLCARLNPYISFLHVSSTHKPTLTFDLIEMFRQQAVDRVVVSLLQKKEKLCIKDGFLDDNTKIKLTENIYERLHRYEKYRGENRRFSDIIKIQVNALAGYINNEEKMFKPYIAKW